MGGRTLAGMSCETDQPVDGDDDGRDIWDVFSLTGARSGMKRSPRTSTSLEVIVALWLCHWLLGSLRFHYSPGLGGRMGYLVTST